MRRRTFFISVLVIVAAATVLNGDATATTEERCTVVTTQYDDSPRIAVWCRDVSPIHYIFGSVYGGNCGPVSIDTIKIWESMLRSALLSGRKVDLDYREDAGCFGGAVRIINTIRLQSD